MTLILSVPNLSARTSDEIELHPEKVKKWLENLPLLNVAETGRKLFSALCAYNRVEFDDKLRWQVLELYRQPIKQISFELMKQYIGLPLPLTDKHRGIAELNRQFQMELAYGYKRILLNTADKPAVLEIDRALRALATQRAIRHLTEVLAVSYQTYSPSPLGVWREIHELYVHADSMGLLPMELEDPLIKAVTSYGIGHAYKQALLLEFSNPYHLPARAVDRVNQYLDRWAPLAQLTAATATYNPTCQFLVDQESDRAGIAYTSNEVLERPGHYQLLNTTELARQVHTQLTQLQQGQMPAANGLSETFFLEAGQDLLRRLVSAWGVNPQRTFRRSQRSGLQIEMAVGLEAINYWLNGGNKFVVSSTLVGPMPHRMWANLTEKKKIVETIPDMNLSTWDVDDESAGGLSISKNGQIHTPVRVGDIIITRTPGEGNPWSIGVIRWAIGVTSAIVEAGIQRLAPSAEPVVIKTVNTANKESDFLPALLLPEIRPLKQPQTLITHHGVYKPDHQVYMDNGLRLYKITPTRMIEASHSFEQFQFDILDT
ncbi:MAG: hypothetical protein AAB134_00430 [Pseudomonadota bacterium]